MIRPGNPPMTDDAGHITTCRDYEARFGRVRRRLERIRRWAAWRIRGLRGRPRRILLEIAWRLGDEVMALPIYSALKQRFPDAHLTVWCTYPDVLDGHPAVDAVNDPAVCPDRYMLLRGTPAHGFRLAHYARRAGVPEPQERPRLRNTDWSTPMIRELPRAHPLAVLCTGASWPTKRWPIARWRELAHRLTAAGWGVVQVGQGDEEIGVGVSLLDRTGVRDAACVLKAADVLISGDTGLMHVARAVDTPALALFGPTDPAILVRSDPGLQVLTNERPCRGCWNRPVGGPRMMVPGVCPLGIPECLDPIAVDAVVRAAQGAAGTA